MTFKEFQDQYTDNDVTFEYFGGFKCDYQKYVKAQEDLFSQALADERQKTIDEILEIINKEMALLEERLRIETYEGRWVDEEKCLFAIERLEHLVEKIKGDTE